MSVEDYMRLTDELAEAQRRGDEAAEDTLLGHLDALWFGLSAADMVRLRLSSADLITAHVEPDDTERPLLRSAENEEPRETVWSRLLDTLIRCERWLLNA